MDLDPSRVRIHTALVSLLVAAAGPVRAQVHEGEPFEAFEWASRPPADCPFEESDVIAGVEFTGRHREYTNADCWFPSWAADGNLYSPFSDGRVENVLADGTRVTVESLGATGPACSVGYGKIVGDDPLDLRVIGLGALPTVGEPYASRYPSGSLVHDGIWYHGSHPEGGMGIVDVEGRNDGWAWVGPFTGFRISRDHGATWSEGPNDPTRPLFGEVDPRDEEGRPIGAPLRIGEPFFVDFGRDMEHSPDGKAYLTAHGATERRANRLEVTSSWCIGDHAYLLRVPPSPETINDASRYEFFAGHDEAGAPKWTRDLAEMEPLLSWPGRVGCASMTFDAPLGRYLFWITDGRAGHGPYDTYLLESEKVTGPWRLVAFLEDFGQQAYFVNLPSKFIGEDGRTAWLCYAANFSGNLVPLESNPPGSRYAMNLQEIRLLAPR